MNRFRSLSISFYTLIILVAQFSWGATSHASQPVCEKPIPDKQLAHVFKKGALNQLALEFGDKGNFVYDIIQSPVDNDLVRIEAFARYTKPGQKDLARMRLKGWVSRCSGTTIIRGNTWLKNGELKVERYSKKQLKGQGLLWGNKDAAMKFIVYVDSRCPHCHRLLDYAKKLVKDGKVMLDIRQVAYLEDKKEAISDTLLHETGLVVDGKASVDAQSYLDMLAGNTSEEKLQTSSKEYKKALALISQNTATAEKVLHIITVPGVLIEEKNHQNQYRKMGYWEINRIFQ